MRVDLGRVHRLQRLGHLPVEQRPPWPQQARVRHLAHAIMAEVEVPIDLAEDAAAHQLFHPSATSGSASPAAWPSTAASKSRPITAATSARRAARSPRSAKLRAVSARTWSGRSSDVSGPAAPRSRTARAHSTTTNGFPSLSLHIRSASAAGGRVVPRGQERPEELHRLVAG